MKKVKLNTTHKMLLADTTTPVSVYLKLRDRFAYTILLESSDYHDAQNRFSYICCIPIASIEVKNEKIISRITGENRIQNIDERRRVLASLSEFIGSFEIDKQPFEFITNGAFGFMAYNAVRYFEDIEIKPNDSGLPDLAYKVYQIVIAIDQFKNELHIFENLPENKKLEPKIDEVYNILKNRGFGTYPFKLQGDETSNVSNDEYLQLVGKGIEHCHRGDVFQIVLSRRFRQQFQGDDFNVYRSLRSINPSPYLFYFDFGNYKLFGSSPEAQIEISKGKASIYPIAGTFRRTGSRQEDEALAEQLSQDPKENSEHVMLVDLARNDLSKHGNEVTVEIFKEVQFFSHVIHLVSKVTASLKFPEQAIELAADTFPAGTLSGAPKYKAMQLIDQYEKTSRGNYGGAIGFIGFNGDFNHAIMIRTFLSMNNSLFYQAGAGIVAKSKPENELQEVNNKLAALRRAVINAGQIEL